MKKTLTIFSLLITLFSFTLESYASFPVKKTMHKTEMSSSDNVNNSEKAEFTVAASYSGKSQIAAALLCWLVGVIGIHRFYLGYTWQGIVQILTLGGLGIWTLVDLIRIIIGTLQPKNGSYTNTF